MSTQIERVFQGPPTDSELRSITKAAAAVAGSKAIASLREMSEADVIAVMLTGHELRVPPMQAINEIWIIQGHISPSAKVRRALCLRAGVRIETVDEGPEHCTVCVTRPDRPEHPYTHTYTLEMAKTAGLVKGDSNWIKNPGRMLYARATGNALNDSCPDIIGGYDYMTEDEKQDAEQDEAAPRVTHQDGEPVPSPFAQEPRLDPDNVEEIQDQLSALARELHQRLLRALGGGAEQLFGDVRKIYDQCVGSGRQPKLADVAAPIMADFASWKTCELGIKKTEDARASDEDALRRWVRKQYKDHGVPEPGGAPADDVEEADFESINPAVAQLKAKWVSEGLTEEEQAAILVAASSQCNSIIDDLDNATNAQIMALVTVTDDVLVGRAEAAGQAAEPEPEPAAEPQRVV